jgi:hypothetical protein
MKFRYLLFGLFAGLLVMSTGYAQQKILKVSVFETGAILLDGKTSTLDEVDAAFARLKESKGTVWYWRENGQNAAPPKQATAVIDLVIKHDLPISLSSKPDFSDYVDDDGIPQPRTP